MQVEAEASTDSNPRAGFVPRQRPGLKIFGKSSSKPASGKVNPDTCMIVHQCIRCVQFDLQGFVADIAKAAACAHRCACFTFSELSTDHAMWFGSWAGVMERKCVHSAADAGSGCKVCQACSTMPLLVCMCCR